MELETSEFDIYLDIDGAVEEDEDEDTVQSESGEHYPVPSDSREQNSQLQWVPIANGHESGYGAGSSTVPPSAKKDRFEASTSGQFVRVHDSDNEEVDVDTPFDGKLFGQTQSKNESTHKTLLQPSSAYTSVSALSGVPEIQAFPKKVAVARKSTTQRKSGFVFPLNKSSGSQHETKTPVSNVAKKSTSKQPKLGVSSSGAKAQLSKARTETVFQVKFGSEKYPFKESQYASSKGFPQRPTWVQKPLDIARKVSNKTERSPALGSTVPMSTSQGSRKMFPCHERSSDRIACPECSVVVKMYCLRAHLRTVHNMAMKNCKKCKITFTDVNLYSEHYARHLQEQEDHLENPSPSKLTTKPYPQLGEYSQLTVPAAMKKQSSTGFSRFPGDIPPLSDPASVKKRKFSYFGGGPASKYHKLSNEMQSAASKITFPFHSKVPPKPRKPSFQTKKRTSAFLPTKQRTSTFIDDPTDLQSEESDSLSIHVQPKLPGKPRKPFSSSKMSLLCSPGRRDSGSSRERRSSTASLQSDLSTSESSEPVQSTSTVYMANRKMASRRPLSGAQDPPSSKKPRYDADTASSTPVAKRYRGKATVTLVSLETASRPYDCKKCLAAFHTALSCPHAFRLHSQTKPHACTNCPAAFSQPEELRTHQDRQCSALPIKGEDGDDSDENGDDDEEFSVSTPFRRHRAPSSPRSQELAQEVPAKSHGKGALFPCPKCTETFQYRSLLLRHIPYHSFQYSCGVCKKAYIQKVDLLNHLQIMHNGRMLLRCKYCEMKFEDMSEFDKHILTHKDGTVVACPTCGQKFGSSRQMHVHLTLDHGVAQKSDCEKCGKRFKQPKLLAIHMRVIHKIGNRGKAVFMCKVCGRRFKKAKLLSVHMEVAHNSAKPVSSKICSCKYCHKVFHRQQGLASHYKLRHGVSLSFALTSESTKHVKNVHESSQSQSLTSSQTRSKVSSTAVKEETNPPLLDLSDRVCQICKKKYTSRKILVTHYRRIHKIEPTGRNSVKCQICGKVVHSMQGLKVHYKVRHRRRISQPAAVSEDPKPVERAAPSMPPNTAPSTALSAAPSTSTKGRCRCSQCGKFFSFTWSLVRHQRLYHRNSVHRSVKTNPVQEKQSKLSVKTSFRGEPLSFQKKGPWTCTVCGKIFKMRKSMRMHVKAEHPRNFTDERFGGRKCRKCKKTFGSKTKLLLHLKTCGLKEKGPNHTDWARSKRCGDFRCMICRKLFHWKQNLLRHLQNNHKLSKEMITYNMSQQKLAQSESCPPEVKLYLCEICKVCFTSRESLSRHRKRRHFGLSGRFQCRRRQCKKVFMQNEALLHHIRTAHPEMSVYWCQGCNSGYETSRDIFSHRCSHTSSSHATAPSAPSTSSEAAAPLHYMNEYSQDESLNSFPTEQECRYKCMTCDIVFHNVREWTKHMQQHNENMGGAPGNSVNQQEMVAAVDKVRMSMFDVLSSSSIFSCKFCGTVFSDENQMNHHICQQPATTSTGPKKAKRKRCSRKNLEPVKCTVCLKLFSPLSMRKHMMRIHSLPMRICTKCNIVFTDLERFQRHNEYHNQIACSQNEDVGVAASVEDELDDTVTFFICQTCGGLFSDAETLELHECIDQNLEEAPLNPHESEDDHSVDTVDDAVSLEDSHGFSNETNESDISNHDMAAHSVGNTGFYAGSNTGDERISEIQTIKTLCEDESDYGCQTRIVIESVTSGADIESFTSGHDQEGIVSSTDAVLKMGNETITKEESVPSFSMSVGNTLTDSVPENPVVAVDAPELLTPHSLLKVNAPEFQDQIQCDSTHSLSEMAKPIYGSSEIEKTSSEMTNSINCSSETEKTSSESSLLCESTETEKTVLESSLLYGSSETEKTSSESNLLYGSTETEKTSLESDLLCGSSETEKTSSESNLLYGSSESEKTSLESSLLCGSTETEKTSSESNLLCGSSETEKTSSESNLLYGSTETAKTSSESNLLCGSTETEKTSSESNLLYESTETEKTSSESNVLYGSTETEKTSSESNLLCGSLETEKTSSEYNVLYGSTETEKTSSESNVLYGSTETEKTSSEMTNLIHCSLETESAGSDTATTSTEKIEPENGKEIHQETNQGKVAQLEASLETTWLGQ